MSNVELCSAKAVHQVAIDDLYQHSVHVWQGPLQDVRILVDGPAQKLAHEYKLNITQREQQTRQGVVIEATVAGLEETARWIWRWGRHARALAPPELVTLCADELRAASARYG